MPKFILVITFILSFSIQNCYAASELQINSNLLLMFFDINKIKHANIEELAEYRNNVYKSSSLKIKLIVPHENNIKKARVFLLATLFYLNENIVNVYIPSDYSSIATRDKSGDIVNFMLFDPGYTSLW